MWVFLASFSSETAGLLSSIDKPAMAESTLVRGTDMIGSSDRWSNEEEREEEERRRKRRRRRGETEEEGKEQVTCQSHGVMRDGRCDLVLPD